MDHQCGSCGDLGCTGLCRAMSDAYAEDVGGAFCAGWNGAHASCAAEIDRLRGEIAVADVARATLVAAAHKACDEIERLRAALRDIASTFGDTADDHMRRRARAALGEDGA